MSKYKILHIGTSEYVRCFHTIHFLYYALIPQHLYHKEEEVIVDDLRDAEDIIARVIKWSSKPMCSEEFDVIKVSDE